MAERSPGRFADFNERRAWSAALVASGSLVPEDLGRARIALGLVPDGARWRQIVAGTLLFAGFALLASALVFAVAFNWDALGHFSRFAMVETLLLGFAAVAVWRGTHTPVGEAALIAACLATGALLALFGQTYQTGADPWSLFFVWAALLLPWVLAAARPAAWLMWLVVANVALDLYCFQVLGESHWVRLLGHLSTGALLTLAFNGALLVTFEALPRLGGQGLARAVPRVLAIAVLGAGATIVIPQIGWDFGSVTGGWSGFNLVIALAAIGLVLWHAYAWRRDLVVLAAGALCVIGVVYTLLGRALLHGDPVGFFMLSSVYWVGAITGAVLWLRQLHAQQLDGRAA